MGRLLDERTGRRAKDEAATQDAGNLISALGLDALTEDRSELEGHADLRERHDGKISPRQEDQGARRHVGQRAGRDDAVRGGNAHKREVRGERRLLLRTVEDPTRERLEKVGLVRRRDKTEHRRRLADERDLHGTLGEHADGRSGDDDLLDGALQAVGTAGDDDRHVGIGLGDDPLLPQALDADDAERGLGDKGVADAFDEKTRGGAVEVDRDANRRVGVFLGARALLERARELVHGNLHDHSKDRTLNGT